MSTSNNMLQILTLFSIEQPILDADQICEQLGFSKPTGYRYIKDLVTHGLLDRLYGGQYTLGPRITIMDYIVQKSNPIIQLSITVMKEIAEQTKLNCCLTQFHQDYCLDIHHEYHKESPLLAYGRGRKRPAYTGSSPKVILANSPVKFQKSIFQKYNQKFIELDFAAEEAIFIQKLTKVKKQGYYFSKAELESHLASISVPLTYSNKALPLSFSVVGSLKRFNLIDIDTMVNILKESTKNIESELYKISADV